MRIKHAPKSLGEDVSGLISFILVCLGISGIGGAVTATSVATWYQGLEKPWFNPPDRVFGPVWILLYVMIAVAGWRVWRKTGFVATRQAFLVYVVQLVLNLGWSFLFFGYQLIGIALLEIFVLWVSILVTMILFWHQDVLAGALFVPYAAWVAFAVLLNLSIWWLN